jgi:hypothetical protein
VGVTKFSKCLLIYRPRWELDFSEKPHALEHAVQVTHAFNGVQELRENGKLLSWLGKFDSSYHI